MLESCKQAIVRWVWVLLVVGLAPAPATGAEAEAAGGEEVFFSKSFPGSVPAYFEAAVKADGDAWYREDAEEEPLEFKMNPGETAEIFELARRLSLLREPLQYDRKVAFTGDKVLRYTAPDGETSQVEFTYTENVDAQAIRGWFERIRETERHLMEIERVMRFDRLGVNRALLLFQISYDDGRIVDAEQFLPLLNKLAAQSKYMHMSRARAASLVQRIETGDQGREQN